MLLLPIAEFELRKAARRPRMWRWRMVPALLAGGVMFWAMIIATMNPVTASVGKASFVILSGLLLALCLPAGLFLTGDCVAREKREGTLGLLFLTDLNLTDILLGKWVAHSATAYLALFATLPVSGIAVSMGGVTGGEFWRMTLLLPVVLTFSLFAGLAVSCVTAQRHTALAGTTSILFVVTAVLPALGALSPGSPSWLGNMSPIRLFAAALDGRYTIDPSDYWSGLVQLLAVSAILPIVGAVALRRATRSGRALEGVMDSAAAKRRRAAPGAIDRESPAAYLIHLYREQQANFLFVFAVGVAATGLQLANLHFVTSSTAVLWLTAGIIALAHLICFIWVASRMVQRIRDERDNGVLEVLLCTPVDAVELLRGQTAGMRAQYRAATAAIAGATVLITALGGVASGEPWGMVGLVVGAGAAIASFHLTLTALAWTSTFMALRRATVTRALLETLILTVLLPWALLAGGAMYGMLLLFLGAVAPGLVLSLFSLFACLNAAGFASMYRKDLERNLRKIMQRAWNRPRVFQGRARRQKAPPPLPDRMV